MSWVESITFLTVLIGICGTAYTAVRFVLSEREKQFRLTVEIDRLKQRLEVLNATLREGVNQYQVLQDISSSAQIAIGADLHSICIPAPRHQPTHLKIIVSTDPKADKIIGKEFPVDKGLSGRVYTSQQPEYVNRAADDPQHYNVVDRAAGTSTGEGAILSYPISYGGICYGVAQFMRGRNAGSFSDPDIAIISRFAEKIALELVSLEGQSTGNPSLGSVPKVFVAVLFSDINDYTQIVKQMSLYQAVNLLDEYYRRMLEIALRHGAAFEEYLGDGLYLSFQHKNKETAVLATLECAREMQREFTKLLAEWKAYDYPVSTRNYQNIGIASGNVFEGSIGHSQYRKRKLVGPAVDRAAHLVERGKPYGACILVDESTRKHAATTTFGFVARPGEPTSYAVD